MKPKKKVFVFIANFIEQQDVKLPIFFHKAQPSNDFKIVSQFNIYNQAIGYIILIQMTPKEILENVKSAQERIFSAALYAQNQLGATVIGLGSLTKSVTSGGKWLAQQKRITTAITHGDTYTVAMTLAGINKIMHEFHISSPTIAIVGCYGTIGTCISHMLADQTNFPLVLYGRKKERVQALDVSGGNVRSIEKTINLDVCKKADIIITAVSSFSAVLHSRHLKDNVVVYDVSQPNGIAPSLLKKRPDIVRIDGAYVSIPNIDIHFWMRLIPNITYACFAEGILQTLERDDNNHVGSIDMEFVSVVEAWGQKWQFSHASLSCYLKPIIAKKDVM